MDFIKLEGSVIKPAKVEGKQDVFQCPQFTLIKPVWVPDENSSHCELCNTKFSQIKRRHHCRMCGAVRCAKCCTEKIPLPQLGLEEAERVCDSCKTITELVTKGRSSVLSFLIESAKGLSTFAKHEKHIKKLVELGGMQTLIMLASTENDVVLGHVVSGLHSLAQHTSLHRHLAEAGAIKAICRVLSVVTDTCPHVAIDGISALMIFCKSSNFKTKALDDGGLWPVLNLCWSENETIALLSLTTLGQIAEHPGTHNAILSNKENALSRLLQLTVAADEQTQEVALKTLAFLSTGTTEHKHRLVQEDFSSGQCILKALQSSPNNPQILNNAACLAANIATSTEDQTGLQDVIRCMCSRLPQAESNTELLCHFTRGLANFAQHKQNVTQLLNAAPDVVKYSLKCSVQPIHLQSMRFFISMLAHSPSDVTPVLMRDGANAFLTNLAGISNLLESAQAALSFDAPDVVKPQ